MKDANEVFDHSVFEGMQCQKHEEEAHYHFALGEIVYYISQYGIDSVMTDIYDMIEVEKNDAKQQEQLALLSDLESRN